MRQPYPLDHASHMPVLIGIGALLKIRSVMELGAGKFSTTLFSDRTVFPDLTRLVSIERDEEWIGRMRNIVAGDERITLTPVEPEPNFDLIFVDNAYYALRIEAIERLSRRSDLNAIVVVHDSENPGYKEQILKFQRVMEFNAFDPETAVMWMRNDEVGTNLSTVMVRIHKILSEHKWMSPVDVPEWKILFRGNQRMSTVSVVMTPYNRGLLMRNTFQTYHYQTRKPDEIIVVEDGFDGGRTMEVCAEAVEWGLPVKYFRRHNRPEMPFSNSAIPRNIGIKKASGEVLILQNAEVRFTKSTDFANIVGPTEADPTISCCAPCEALDEQGNHKIWYCDPNLWNYNHFCQAYRRDRIIAIGGFDETFRGYGYEDNDFNWRLENSGVTFQWAKDVVMQHQWHEVKASPQDKDNEAFNIAYGSKQVYDYRDKLRGLESNIGKDWGNPNS